MDFTAILFVCVIALSIWLFCVFLMLRAEYLQGDVRTAKPAHDEMENTKHAKNRTRLALAIRRRRDRPKDSPETSEAGGE